MGKRVTIVIAALVAAGAGVLWLALPHRIEVRVRNAVAARVARADVEAEYSASTLWTGRLDSVVLEGVVYELDLDRGAHDLAAMSPEALCAAAEALPADRLDVRGASVALVRGDRRWNVRVDAALSRRDGHTVLRATAAPAGGGDVTAVARCDRSGRELRASVTVRGRLPALRVDDVGADALAFELDAAWTGDELAALAGTAEANTITGRDLSFFDVAGRLRLDGAEIAVEVSSVSELGRVDAAARVPVGDALSKDAVAWRVDVDAPYLDIASDHLLHRWVAGATGVGLTGELGYRAHFEGARGAVRRRIDVSLIDASIESVARGIRVDGLRGDLSLDSLSPPRTREEQHVLWAGATVGEHRIGAGVARFAIDDDGAIALRLNPTDVDLTSWVPQLSQRALSVRPQDLVLTVNVTGADALFDPLLRDLI